MVQSSYDSRAAPSASMTRAMAAPQYMHQPPSYTNSPTESMVMAHHGMSVHQQPFNFNSYQNANINLLVPAMPGNYMPARPAPRLTQPGVDEGRSYDSCGHQPCVDTFHRQSPPIKPELEPHWSPSANSPVSRAGRGKNTPCTTPDARPNEVSFDTEVDTLMKAIQAKSQTAQAPQKLSDQAAPREISQPSPYGAASSPQNANEDSQEDFRSGKRRYQCQMKNCNKSFYQKTHLDIHERAHTGFKPYVSVSVT